MGTITVNGKTYHGNNLQIVKGVVIVDGVVADQSQESVPSLKIGITGDVGDVEVSGSLSVRGNVLGDVTAKGSVSCANVGGSVDAGGSVNCDDVGGDVTSGGSVNADKIKGSVTARNSVSF